MKAKIFFPLILLMLNNCITLAGKIECKAGINLSLEDRERFLEDEEYRKWILKNLPAVHVTNNISRMENGQFYMKAGAIFHGQENIPSTETKPMVPIPRGTIHFTLGGQVADHDGGTWIGKLVAVVTTIGILADSGKLVSLHPHDTWGAGDYMPGINDIIVAPIDFLKGFSWKIKIGYNDFNGQKIYAYDSSKKNLKEALTQVFDEKKFEALLRDPGAVKYGDKAYWNGLNFTNRSLYGDFLNNGIGFGNHAYTTGQDASRLATVESIARNMFMDNLHSGGSMGKHQVSFLYDLLNFLYEKIKVSNLNEKLKKTGYIFTPHWVDVLDVLNRMTPENGSIRFNASFDPFKYFDEINKDGAISTAYNNLERSETMKGKMGSFFKENTEIYEGNDNFIGGYTKQDLLNMLTWDDLIFFVD